MSNIIDGEHAGGCRDLNCVGCVEVSPVQGGYFDAGDWNKRVARAERDARVDLSLSAVDATCRAVRAEGVREGVQQAISKVESHLEDAIGSAESRLPATLDRAVDDLRTALDRLARLAGGVA